MLCLAAALSVFILVSSAVKGQVDYSCPLEWVPQGFGNVPLGAVSPNPGEFVARVNLADYKIWRLGRLLPLEGTAHVPYFVEDGNHQVIESDTYEVLTNPYKCVLKWVTATGGQVPGYAISGDDIGVSPNQYVARGEVAGVVMAGALIPKDSALYVPYEGHVYLRRHYEVLTSSFSRLSVSLRDFTFPGLDLRLIDEKSHLELFGQSELYNEFKEDEESSISYPVLHTKGVNEVFRLTEKYLWLGFSNISLVMDLWGGSPSVIGEVKEFADSTHALEIKRQREVSIQRTLAIRPGSSHPELYSQVCSAVRRLKNFPIKFDAIGEVSTAEGMESDKVKELLLRTGRNVLGVDEWSGNVLVKIQGKLSGSYVVGVFASYSPRDEHGPCSSLISDNWEIGHHGKWS